MSEVNRRTPESGSGALLPPTQRAAPVFAVGDDALGFQWALREIFPETGKQNSWFHKKSNTLAALSKSFQLGARAAMKEIRLAATSAHSVATHPSVAFYKSGSRVQLAAGKDLQIALNQTFSAARLTMSHASPRHASWDCL